MAHISTREQVYQYLEQITPEFDKDLSCISPYTTLDICNHLNMSRSLVSLYLNDMVKEGTVIKICSRPVYYLNRIALEHKYHIQLECSEYLSLRQLLAEIQKSLPNKRDFESAVGCEGSLNYCINQIKSALKYPGGLPILLKGNPGSGKTFLMKLIQEYCVNCQLLKQPEKYQRLKITASTDSAVQERLLFGSEGNKKGLLDELNGGILYIENISALGLRVQEKLADYIALGAQRRSGEQKSGKAGNVRLVMSVDEKEFATVSKRLILNIPVICDIPSWEERNQDERRELVLRFFQKEQERMKKSIYISEKLIYKLVQCQFEHNISELAKCVTMIAADAYSQNIVEDRLSIYLYNLPVSMWGILSVDKDDSPLVRLDSLQMDVSADKILDMWKTLLDDYKSVQNKSNAFEMFLESGKRTLKYYYDILIFQESFLDGRLRPLEKIVTEIISVIRGTYNINFPANCAYVIARILLTQQNHNSQFQIWQREHKSEIEKIHHLMEEKIPDIFFLTELIGRKIQENINIRMSDMNRIFIALNIHTYNHRPCVINMTGIVLCHGYTTASSIADTVNTTLGAQIFEAIDMPLESSIHEVLQKLTTFISANRYFKNIILMVDTGSLEELGQALDGSVTLGVINNVSTILALNIGNMMLAGEDMQTILETACRENQCRYSIFSRVKKERVILFTSDAGKNISEKLTRLFYNSLPKPIPLEMIPYDFKNLQEKGDKDLIFEKYDVVLLIKTLNLKIPGIKSVTLEEIISFKSINVLDEVLSEYLNVEEIECFNQSLLKNFSLQSVMENLTILNAQKLLDYVNDFTMLLQQQLQRKFMSKTIIGINMHICFLIERLVTKTPIENYKDIDKFIKEQKVFIDIVSESFQTLLEHYNVELPISEIAYLYEYILNDVEVEVNENKF